MTDVIAHLSAPRIEGTDDFFRAVLRDAELPALLPALAQATGDLRLVDASLRPLAGPIPAVPRPQGGMGPEAQERARELAFEALVLLRDGDPTPLDVTDGADLMPLVTFMTGEENTEYLPLVNHELGFDGDLGAPDWTIDEIDPDRAESFRAVVIGAGPQGIQAAYRLTQAGIRVSVFEKNDQVGGTWYENSYPGCRLDTPNFTYSYSFFQKSTWPQAFTEQKHLGAYFAEAAEALGVLPLVTLDTEVESAVFDDDTAQWSVVIRNANGVQTVVADIVISAVGQLNRPAFPDIPGADTFEGEKWHTIEWRHDVDLTGKKVAVIGTGATGIQVIPTIAPQVEHLTVFQRTPPWMYPAADYHAEIPDGMRWLLGNIPFFHRWYRFVQFYMNLEGRVQFMERDPEWEHPVSSSAKNEELRAELEKYIRAEFADRPDLVPHMVPAYPPGAKRMLRDNGIWARTLKSDHVDVVHSGIDRIEPRGIVDRDGTFHEVDVIVYSTGFKASQFLAPMTVKGREGADLHTQWQGDVPAYFGVNVPHFPNLFVLYGPNTNLVVNGSLILLQEMGVEFILGQLKHLLEAGKHSIEVNEEPFEAYNEWLDAGNARMSWSDTKANSWYRSSASGRSSQNWPYSMLDYWKGTHGWESSIFTLR